MTTQSKPSAARKKLKLYAKLDARFDDSDEDPRASLVNLVDVMLVFACGLLAAISASSQSHLSVPQPVEKGREISRPASEGTPDGVGYARVGEVFRDPKTGKLLLIEPSPTSPSASTISTTRTVETQ